MRQVGPVISRHGLDVFDLSTPGLIQWNLPPAALIQQAVRRKEGMLVTGGAFNAVTGRHTGRSPKDKFMVDHEALRAEIDWGSVNQPFDPAAAAALWAKARRHVEGRD